MSQLVRDNAAKNQKRESQGAREGEPGINILRLREPHKSQQKQERQVDAQIYPPPLSCRKRPTSHQHAGFVPPNKSGNTSIVYSLRRRFARPRRTENAHHRWQTSRTQAACGGLGAAAADFGPPARDS